MNVNLHLLRALIYFFFFLFTKYTFSLHVISETQSIS